MARLVSLTASFLNNKDRLKKLRRLCNSIKTQQLVQEAVVVMVGIAGPLVADHIAALRDDFNTVTFVDLGPGQLAQFEIYNLLSKQPQVAAARWVMFSDDDDLWHPMRVACYLEAIDQAQPTIASVQFEAVATGAPGESVQTYLNVDQGLAEARITLMPVDDVQEFWCYAVRVSVFCAFFASMAAELLQIDVCDMMFAYFVRTFDEGELSATLRIAAPKNTTWLYFYEYGGDDQATRNIVPAADITVHGFQQYQQINKNPGGDVDKFQRVISMTRRVVDMSCCRNTSSRTVQETLQTTFGGWVHSAEASRYMWGIARTRAQDLLQFQLPTKIQTRAELVLKTIDAAYHTSGLAGLAKARPKKVGRNGPCPCGCGKKYKKCLSYQP